LFKTGVRAPAYRRDMTDDKTILETLKLAASAASGLVRDADFDLDAPSPSASWDARETANHFVLWTAYALDYRGQRKELGEDMTGRDFVAEPDWKNGYAEAMDHALEVWSDPATFEGTIGEGDGAMGARDIAVMLLLEFVLHGWDFAKTTGQDYAPDPAVGEFVLPVVEQYAAMYRKHDGFGEPVEVPADASSLDKALALSGRDPNWTP